MRATLSSRTGYLIDGVRLGQARVAAGLTQQALADKAEVHRVTLVKIEAGTRRVSLDVVERIAAALDTSRGWLLGEPDEVDEFEMARERMANAVSKITDGFEDMGLAFDLLNEARRAAGLIAAEADA